jgi:hypothetical protein
MNMITKEAQGFTREAAFNATAIDADYSKFKNATIAWKKKGSPLNTKELNRFAAEYLAKQKAVGAFIVIEGSSADTRERPYKVYNEVTNGKRKQKRFYQVVEAELQTKSHTVINEEGEPQEVVTVTVLSEGVVVAKADKKETAIKLMKECIDETKKNYAIKIVSEVVEGQPYASYGVYAPSKSAKLGKFVFFSIE